jgi:hypothetical protein
MRVMAVHTLSMTVIFVKTRIFPLREAVSVIVGMGGMAVSLIKLRLYILGSLTAVMAGLAAHLIACLPITLKEQVGDQTTSIVISMRVMAIAAVAVIGQGRPWRR